MSIEYARAYAARGWAIFPIFEALNGVCACGRDCGKNGGKHPRVTGGFKAATTEIATLDKWWKKWPRANLGIATGRISGLLILDIDGEKGLATLRALVARHGPLPWTAIVRTARGVHLYFQCTEAVRSSSGDGLETRADGGYVVGPPSIHLSGFVYREEGRQLADAPAWLVTWAQTRHSPGEALIAPGARAPFSGAGGMGAAGPAGRKRIADRALAAVSKARAPIADITAALEALPNREVDWDSWNRIGLAVWAATGGGDDGRVAFDKWSAKSSKYDGADVVRRWAHFATSPPATIGFGALVFEVRKWVASWTPPTRVAREVEAGGASSLRASGQQSGPALPAVFQAGASGELKKKSPLEELNERYAVIGNVGGKCLIMSWVPSKADAKTSIPSFQAFKSFSDRYANRYVAVAHVNKKGEAEEKYESLGAHWLKWGKRRTYEGIDLQPGQPDVLPTGELNLWRGFGVSSPEGSAGWPLMRQHIEATLAAGDPANSTYILRWAAWAVQNPGERAEVAIVFRGGKGSGKGTFGHAMRRLFGMHGLHVSNSRHLVGNFNAHLRTCCLLFADEAFWAGDKAGESTLKSVITEPTLFIEQKGVDGIPWKNRLHVMMAANAEWVVPASHDERRYAMFDVSNDRIGDSAYFAALNHELENGGLGAMLRDLLAMDLRGWHPRRIVQTEALKVQKMRSMDSRWQWFEGLLQQGWLPYATAQRPDQATSSHLMESFREFDPRNGLTPMSIGLFLRERGCIRTHTRFGKAWRFLALGEMRTNFIAHFKGWNFEDAQTVWLTKADATKGLGE